MVNICPQILSTTKSIHKDLSTVVLNTCLIPYKYTNDK